MIISIFIPHGGCPERCTFCDQKTSGGDAASPSQIVTTIEQHLAQNSQAEAIAFYGGTFTALNQELQRKYLEAAKPYLDSGRIQSVRIATRPDAVGPHNAAWLKEMRDVFKLKTVELGVQSYEPAVLLALGRSHTSAHVNVAVQTLKELSLTIGLHLMIGCPNESNMADEQSVQNTIRLKPDFVRIHPLLVIEGTALASPDYRDRFGFKTIDLEQAIERASKLVQRFSEAGIGVVRLGLQPNELLGLRLVDGPYHPAFGDLVKGRILRESIARELVSTHCEGRAVTIFVTPKADGTLKGPGKSNLIHLKDRFKLSSIEVSVVEDPSLYGKQFKLRIHHFDRPTQRGQVELT